MKYIKKITNNKLLLAFLLSGLLGLLIVLPTIIINDGIYSLTKDLNVQQIPFNKLINNSLKNGELFWTWSNDLGSSFIPTFSFYNLLSPFNLIGYLFPSSLFEYLIGPLYILKYAITGLTSFLFLKRYVKNKNYAIIGSLLYTFSGFNLTNILFFHFHDAVAFFPLLLYTLDNLMYDNKKVGFALSLSLCAFTNWFFFIGECIFLMIYFIIKLITKEYKLTLKNFFYLTTETIIGVSLATIVLLPSALFTLGNTRLDTSWTLSTAFFYPLKEYAEIIRALISPSEVMNIRSLFSEFNYRSVELYLPIVGSVLACSHIIKNKKSWESLLMIILTVFMFIPILNSTFTLFQTTYYARWFFMPTLILSLLSIKCLESKLDIKPGIKFTLALSSLLLIIIFILKNDIKIIYDKPYFILIILFLLINLLTLYFINKKETKKEKYLIIAIFIFVTFWGNLNVYYYKEKRFTTKEKYFNYLKSNEILNIEENVRTNSTSSCDYNLGYILKNNNIRTFNSNINSSSFEFYKSIGIYRKVKTKIDIKNKDLNDLLGVKYIISCNQRDLTEYGYTLYDTKGKYNIYENKEYLNFGFPVKNYITQKEFNKLTNNEKIKTLKEKVLLNEEQIKKYKNIFNENSKHLSNDFFFTKNGFKSVINTTEENFVIYQIPYDKGFKATINGKKTTFEKVDNGLIGIKLNKGKNIIEFTYITPGLIIGLIISLLSLLFLIAYIIFIKFEKIILRYYKKYEEIINYLIIGALTTLISLIIYYVLVLTILNPNKALELQIANIISWIFAVAFAYITNRIFVFKSKNTNIKKEITSFISSRLLTLLIDMFSMFILVTTLNINDKISKLLVQILVIILNYIFSKIFVFK